MMETLKLFGLSINLLLEYQKAETLWTSV